MAQTRDRLAQGPIVKANTGKQIAYDFGVIGNPDDVDWSVDSGAKELSNVFVARTLPEVAEGGCTTTKVEVRTTGGVWSRDPRAIFLTCAARAEPHLFSRGRSLKQARPKICISHSTNDGIAFFTLHVTVTVNVFVVIYDVVNKQNSGLRFGQKKMSNGKCSRTSPTVHVRRIRRSRSKSRRKKKRKSI